MQLWPYHLASQQAPAFRLSDLFQTSDAHMVQPGNPVSMLRPCIPRNAASGVAAPMHRTATTASAGQLVRSLSKCVHAISMLRPSGRAGLCNRGRPQPALLHAPVVPLTCAGGHAILCFGYNNAEGWWVAAGVIKRFQLLACSGSCRAWDASGCWQHSHQFCPPAVQQLTAT
jgi:hypothetical protein